jgi:hypothetical protein
VTHSHELAFRALDRSLLLCASLLVPANQRAEWSREWQAELWHVRQSRTLSDAILWQAEREIVAFCLGAWQDAACLRHHSWQNRAKFAPMQGSAAQCLLRLAAVLSAAYIIGLLLPGVRASKDLSWYQIRAGTILIQGAHSESGSTAALTIGRVQAWRASRQRYFDGFAFYRTGPELVSVPAGARAKWQIAHATSNLFALLGVPVRFVIPDRRTERGMPHLILSVESWRRAFRADPSIIGKVLRVGQQEVQVVGIGPEGAWRLPGRADAWLLEPDAGIVASTAGYAVAHLTHRGEAEMWKGQVLITSHDSGDSTRQFWGTSLGDRQPSPWDIYRFGILLALLALPAVTSVSLGEYSFSVHKPSWIRRAARAGFLAAKIVLLLSISYFLSLDLAFWHSAVFTSSSAYIELVSSFSICLFGMRWIIWDQRQRCPVCLRRVAYPAQVGLPSRTFLAWNGIEMICTEGHTLLHVPGLPTSWFSTPRWMYLDTSWDFLFAN